MQELHGIKMEVAEHNLEDLTVNMSVSYETTITSDEVNGFAELSGDVSPLHVDPDFGSKTVFGTNLVHGMLISSHFSTIVGVLLPGRNALLNGIELDFLKPVPVDSELTVSVSIIRIQRSDRMIVLRLLAILDGVICVKGKARVKIMSSV